MEWVIVLSLIIIGFIIMLVELVVIPGTTVVGILGFGFSVYGVYKSYVFFGTGIGNVVLIVSALLMVIGTYLSFKLRLWDLFSLRGELSEKVNQGKPLPTVGEKGMTHSALRPSGSVSFESTGMVEVFTQGEFVDAGSDVEVIKLEGRKVWVKAMESIEETTAGEDNETKTEAETNEEDGLDD